jgi:hypothetical protein
LEAESITTNKQLNGIKQLLGEALHDTATEQSRQGIALRHADNEIIDIHASGPVESKTSLNLATESFGVIRK